MTLQPKQPEWRWLVREYKCANCGKLWAKVYRQGQVEQMKIEEAGFSSVPGAPNMMQFSCLSCGHEEIVTMPPAIYRGV